MSKTHDLAPFWETVSLDDLSDSQWESLCDGCGRCCLHKFIDDETDELFFTDVACRYLSHERSLNSDPAQSSACHCRAYESREEKVADCMNLKTVPREQLGWMPSTCAYRRLYENKALPAWHPLLTGSRAEMDRQQLSLRFHPVQSETHFHADEIEEREIKWVS